jgi:hypothetical protein
MGGIREHRVIMDNLQADAFRSASQSQKTGQAARAFSGANVTNVQDQTGNITQMVVADNTKTVTIAAVLGTNEHAANFNFNYLQKYITGADASDYLARGAANVAQDQGGDQSAFAKLNGFEGSDISTAFNDLGQNAVVVQQFDVDLTATLSNTTSADEVGDAFNQSRFRTIEANLEDQSAQAIFTSGQRQGHAEAPVTMVAVSDGGDSDNVLEQMAVISQNQNDVRLTGDFDLDRDETAPLSPRTTDLFVRMNAQGGVNSAINSSAACQEQAIVQSAAGGVDEAGNVTENDGTAQNLGRSTAINTESTTVVNSISISI